MARCFYYFFSLPPPPSATQLPHLDAFIFSTDAIMHSIGVIIDLIGGIQMNEARASRKVIVVQSKDNTAELA